MIPTPRLSAVTQMNKFSGENFLCSIHLQAHCKCTSRLCLFSSLNLNPKPRPWPHDPHQQGVRGEFLLQPMHSWVAPLQAHSSSSCRTCLFPHHNPLPWPRPYPWLNPSSTPSATAGMSKSQEDNSFGSLVWSTSL